MTSEVKVAREDSNGVITVPTVKLFIALVTVFVVVLSAGTPAVLLLANMNQHVGDTQKHEDRATKEKHIDARFNLLFAPFANDLEHMNEKIDDIHDRVVPPPPNFP